jgi:pimeloyl-ACP methyl ester carboxylesterase
VERGPELDEALQQAIADFEIEAPSLDEPFSRRVSANGLELRCLDWGGDAEPVLFLHGGNQTAHAWDLVCLQLRRCYRCLAVDLRGHGESDFPEDGRWEMQVQARDVRALIDELAIERPVLVGFSMGSWVATAFAALWPDALRAAVFVDGAPTLADPDEKELFELMGRYRFESLEEAVAHHLAYGPQVPSSHQRYYLLRTARRKDSGAWVTPRRWGRFGAPPEEMTRDTEALWDLVPRITCPSLVVRGEQSNILSPELAGRFTSLLQRAGAYQTVTGAGHMVPLDQPRRLADAIGEFLATVLPGTDSAA